MSKCRPSFIFSAFLPRLNYSRKIPASRKPVISHYSKMIAVCQLRSSANKDENFKICRDLINAASAQRAQMVFLPEAFDYISETEEETIRQAEPLDGPLLRKYKQLALANNIWLSLGGFHEKTDDESKICNTHVIINNLGGIVEAYRKIHLFDVNLPEKNLELTESKTVQNGSRIVNPVVTPVGSIGMSICYDLRFPEMSLMLTKMGATILTYPSAFTYDTGSMHWETLLRARAIENQVYVVAAGQCGRHNSKRRSWGHSMVVDPNGSIIAQCSEGIGYSLATVDLNMVGVARREMPVWNHKRYDLYPPVLPYNHSESSLVNQGEDPLREFYTFGQVKVPKAAVFLKTNLTMAFTNKRCVVPGHVLVAPLRVVTRLCDMTPAEIADMIMVVQKVERVIEKVVGSCSSTVAIQDGPDAGQTIKHVHVHILPRRPGDFPRNDEIYHQLEQHDKLDDLPYRSFQEMAEEAAGLKKFFDSNYFKDDP